MVQKSLLAMASDLEPFVQVELPTETKFGLFLEYLMDHGDITQACRQADLSPKSMRKFRREHPKAEAAFKEALDIGTDQIEAELHRRAVTGYLEPVFYKGRRVNTVRRKSDILLMFLLKKRRPEYRDNYQPPPEDPNLLNELESPAEKIARRLDGIAKRQREE